MKIISTLPEIKEGQNLSNLIEQSMWYGSSLGRLGCDFRGNL